MEFFLSFRSFKSRKKMTEFFFSGPSSLSFHMMHKFPGIFSFLFSLTIHFFLWLCISLTINFNLREKSCMADFSKYCKSYFPATQINGFIYIMSEEPSRVIRHAAVQNIFRNYYYFIIIIIIYSGSIYKYNGSSPCKLKNVNKRIMTVKIIYKTYMINIKVP